MWFSQKTKEFDEKLEDTLGKLKGIPSNLMIIQSEIRMVHREILKGVPFKIATNLKRMLMVPFEKFKEFPSKSKRIQRGNLRESIGKLKEIEHNLKKHLREPFEIQRVSFRIPCCFCKVCSDYRGMLLTPALSSFLRFFDGTPIKF